MQGVVTVSKTHPCLLFCLAEAKQNIALEVSKMQLKVSLLVSLSESWTRICVIRYLAYNPVGSYLNYACGNQTALTLH